MLGEPGMVGWRRYGRSRCPDARGRFRQKRVKTREIHKRCAFVFERRERPYDRHPTIPGSPSMPMGSLIRSRKNKFTARYFRCLWRSHVLASRRTPKPGRHRRSRRDRGTSRRSSWDSVRGVDIRTAPPTYSECSGRP